MFCLLSWSSMLSSKFLLLPRSSLSSSARLTPEPDVPRPPAELLGQQEAWQSGYKTEVCRLSGFRRCVVFKQRRHCPIPYKVAQLPRRCRRSWSSMLCSTLRLIARSRFSLSAAERPPCAGRGLFGTGSTTTHPSFCWPAPCAGGQACASAVIKLASQRGWRPES